MLMREEIVNKEETNMDALVSTPSKTEEMHRMEQIVHELLGLLGENQEREGLLKTPKRVAMSLKYLTQGYLYNQTLYL